MFLSERNFIKLEFGYSLDCNSTDEIYIYYFLYCLYSIFLVAYTLTIWIFLGQIRPEFPNYSAIPATNYCTYAISVCYPGSAPVLTDKDKQYC
jgi:hypothetical protein